MSQHAQVPTSFVMTAADTTGGCRSVQGTYPECPLCGSDLFPEHAHFKCSGCGWRDSCCD
jgi:peptide methionine sulfoxide reductase MsrB